MDTAEREKRKKCLHACIKELRNFTLFIPSVDGLVGVRAEITLKRLASLLATKWNELYSRTCGYVKGRVEITAKI